MDPRVERLAQVLVHYSLAVQPGEWVILSGSHLAEDLLKAALLEVLAAGGHPTLNVAIQDANSLVMRRASDEQLAFVSPSELAQYRKADKFLFVMGGWNSRALTRVAPERWVKAQKGRKVLMETLMKRHAAGEAAWVGTLFPTQSSAQDAEMSLPEYEEFVFRACLLHKKDPVAEWRRISASQAAIASELSKITTLHIQGPDTDLTVNVGGRTWVNCDGHVNFPDGEIFTGPVEDSAEGTIRFTFPGIYNSRAVENVRLTFKQGKVVDARADKGEELLHAAIDSDPGARRVGELAFGTNSSVQQFTRNTLFDEKIGGTMHLALGASLPQSGGKNQSVIHWDLVCDTRKGFTIRGDGRPIHKNGRFLFAG